MEKIIKNHNEKEPIQITFDDLLRDLEVEENREQMEVKDYEQ